MELTPDRHGSPLVGERGGGRASINFALVHATVHVWRIVSLNAQPLQLVSIKRKVPT